VTPSKLDPKAIYPEAKPEFDFKLFDFKKVLAPLSANQIMSILKFNNAQPAVMRKSDMMSQAETQMYGEEDIPF
jgi:hypothetical protein